AKLQHLIKSLITWKRYMIEQKFTLITNRKSAIAFQNPALYLTCDANWRRNRRYVTSGLLKKFAKIVYNLETVRDRANVNIIRKSEVDNCLSESAIIFNL